MSPEDNRLSEKAVWRRGGVENMELVSNGYAVSVWDDEQVLEMGQWWRLRSTVDVFTAAELYT